MDFSRWLDSIMPLAAGLPALRAVLAVIIVFFLPGFAWSLVFFNRISIIERLALSVGLSIALVTLSVLVLNVALGMKINGANSLVSIVGITFIALVLYLLKHFIFRKPEASKGE